MIQENVRGAIPWVGRSAWNFGSYHLWGDVPALMPMTLRAVKVGGKSLVVNGNKQIAAEWRSKSFATNEALKGAGDGWFNDGKRAGRSGETGRLRAGRTAGPDRPGAAEHAVSQRTVRQRTVRALRRAGAGPAHAPHPLSID